MNYINLIENNKKNRVPLVFRNVYIEKTLTLADVSKTENIGFAVIIDKVVYKFRLLTKNSIFTVVTLVVVNVIKIVNVFHINIVNILTDSLSTIKNIFN